MKKYFFAIMAICAVVFCGCSKDDDEAGGSLVIDGVNLVGTWTLQYEDNGLKPGYIEELVVFTEKDFRGYYISDETLGRFRDEDKPWNEWGFTYSNGYLYGCTMRDFEPDGPTLSITLKGGKLYVAGIDMRVQVINEDKMTWYGPFDDKAILQRVKGFK